MSESNTYREDCCGSECELHSSCQGNTEKCVKREFDDVLSALTHHEQLIIRKSFGFDGNPPAKIESFSEELYINNDRAVLIEKKAIRKLRHPMYSRRLLKCGQLVYSCEESCYSRLIKAIFGYKGSREVIHQKILDDTKEREITENSWIDEIGITGRPHNCLKRHGIDTIGALISLNLYDLSQVRCFRKIDAEFLVYVLDEYGFRLRDCSKDKYPLIQDVMLLIDKIGFRDSEL